MHVRFGVAVTLVKSGPRLAGKEEPSVVERLASALRDDGVDVRLEVERFELVDGRARAYPSDGRKIDAAGVLVATGRTPTTAGLGLEATWIEPDDNGAVDMEGDCRVVGQPHVWAVGDITGTARYTRTADYQARIVPANLLGGQKTADRRAIQRAIYTSPALPSVGMAAEQAREQGIDATNAVGTSGRPPGPAPRAPAAAGS